MMHRAPGVLEHPAPFRLRPPVFDVVPSRGRALVLRPAPDAGWTADPVAAFAHHEAFGLDRDRAEEAFTAVVDAVAGFEDRLAELGVSDLDRDLPRRMMPAAGLRHPPARPGFVGTSPPSP